MDAAINCLERELATLANNFAASAEAALHADTCGEDEQQNLRWNQMADIRRGIASLRHVSQGTMMDIEQQIFGAQQGSLARAAR